MFAVPMVFAASALAADFPGEISDPCVLFGYCDAAQLGASGAISVFSGAGSLTAIDITRPGSLLDPWILQADTPGSPFYLSFVGAGPGGPLRSPTDLNPTGTGHATGRFFLLTLTNNSLSAWQGVRLDLELTPGTPSSTHDALTFGEGLPDLNELDLLQFFSSNRFSQVTRVPATFIPDAHEVPGIGTFSDFVTDAVIFSGGTVLPNQTVNLLVGINNGVGVGVAPNFYLRVDAGQPAIPEPSTMGLAGFAIVALVILRRRQRRTSV
jgi:hypothetical protein